MRRTSGFKIFKTLYYIMVTSLFAGVSFLAFRLVSHEPVDIASIIMTVKDREVPLKTEINIAAPERFFVYQMPFMRGFNKAMSRGDAVDRNVSTKGEAQEGMGDIEVVNRQEQDTLEGIEPILEADPEIPEDIKIIIEKIEDDLDPIELSGTDPQILIYHSHSREAYMQEPGREYVEVMSEPFRSDDLNSTVISVGSALAHSLQELGIPVLHDRTEHEQGNYNGSYVKSLETLKRRMAEYDSLKIFLDVHRNAYKKGTKTPDQEVVIVDGKRVAKMSIVIGTGKGQLGGFKEKPNWKENYKLAQKLTDKLNEICPGIAKPILVKNSRYNQHVSENAILLEVGSNMTTLTEAERTAEYIAKALKEITIND
ncbi:MAG: stage II sporulation protein P [Clostridiales bacterium]|nr:stage II sporulation protein P [Clostridiales bacterium]